MYSIGWRIIFGMKGWTFANSVDLYLVLPQITVIGNEILSFLPSPYQTSRLGLTRSMTCQLLWEYFVYSAFSAVLQQQIMPIWCRIFKFLSISHLCSVSFVICHYPSPFTLYHLPSTDRNMQFHYLTSISPYKVLLLSLAPKILWVFPFTHSYILSCSLFHIMLSFKFAGISVQAFLVLFFRMR